jgi:DNA invertase Pin-like site-specific DNA recombinase
MKYGYKRVSARGQQINGNSLTAQEEALKAAGAEKIYSDTMTGTKMSRPNLDKLLSVIKPQDTFIVTKLDRVARTAAQGILFIQALLEKDVIVHVLNMGIIDNSPMSRAIRTMMLAFAELERDLIVERTTEGKAIAKLKPDYKDGRPYLEVPEFGEYYDKVCGGEISVSDAVKKLGISRSKWYRLCEKEKGEVA